MGSRRRLLTASFHNVWKVLLKPWVYVYYLMIDCTRTLSYLSFYNLKRVYYVCHEVPNTHKETSETVQNIYLNDHRDELIWFSRSKFLTRLFLPKKLVFCRNRRHLYVVAIRTNSRVVSLIYLETLMCESRTYFHKVLRTFNLNPNVTMPKNIITRHAIIFAMRLH